MVKIKEVNVTANYAWSPAENHPIYIAAGTAAQQLDASFSSNASLSLYEIDIADTAKAAKCSGKVEVANRFQKIIWGSSYPDCVQKNGMIVCGTDKGGIEIYDPDKILENSDDCLILSTSKHTGPVRSLDFNPIEKNLFASGASEIFIWNLKNPKEPMTPSKDSQSAPTSAISSIAWNRQAKHILASTSTLTSGPCCIVWDLKTNKPIIKVQDPSGRMQCSDIAWHPEIATQLVLASEDDHVPVVQLWDLRFATSPMKVLEKHKRGVVSVSWCPRDPDLLLSCGKDNQVYCWNPNATPPEVIHELETHAQWCFDVQWCPRNPNVVSTGSFDGRISIHSLMGGGFVMDDDNEEDKQRSVVAEAFGTAAFPDDQQQSRSTSTKKISVPLKKPPKWMRKPCGASFVFGGKLVTFQDNPPADNQQKQHLRRIVNINQVVTEDRLLQRSRELRQALTDDVLCSDFCQRKIDDAQNAHEEDFWSFVKVNFESDPRKEYLQLLGYNAVELKNKFYSAMGKKSTGGELASQMNNISLSGQGEPSSQPISNSSSLNGLDVFEQIASASEASEKLETAKPMLIPTNDDLDSMISQALLIGDYNSAVDLCLHGGRMADAIVVAIAGGPELLERTQKKYFQSSESKTSRLLSAVVTKDWKDIVNSCNIDNWKEALASLLTYATPEDLINYCDELGERLEGNEDSRLHACLCYVCSGNIDKLVRCWDKIKPASNSKDIVAMQDLVEKMMVLLRVVETRGQSTFHLGSPASDKLGQYASILAAEGQLGPAMEILPMNSDKQDVMVLRDRLYHSQGGAMTGKQPPPFPFVREGILGQRPSAQVQPRQQSRRGYNQPTYAQPTSMIQPMQQPTQQPLAPTHVPQPTTVQQLINPYANPAMQRQQPYSTSQLTTPANIFTPQPATAAAPSQPYAPNVPLVSSYQPYSTAPVSNGSMVMQPQAPPSTAPVPPSPTDSYGEGVKHQAGGWNDPPVLDPNRIPRRKKPTPKTFIPENFNIMTPMQPAQLPPNAMGAPLGHPGAMGMPTSVPGMMQPAPNLNPPGAMIGAIGQQQPHPPHPAAAPPAMMQNLQPTISSAPSVPTAAPKDTPKPPIPAEHQILQTQFDELIRKCMAQANNAQWKRKLDECKRRIEFLYDKLRNNSLSPNIVSGLHQIARSVASRDYATGLRYHTQIVSHSNFSEISAFMPGLKSMIQIANQLKI